MKKLGIFIGIIVILVILFPKSMGYSGGFTGGSINFKHCAGYVFTFETKGPPVADGISSTTYCIGIPFN